MVLHVDARDTIFQKDVFKFYKNKKHFIGLALEDGNMTNKYSSSWMKHQYGKKIILFYSKWFTILIYLLLYILYFFLSFYQFFLIPLASNIFFE